MEIRPSHLRYLLAIYKLGKKHMDVGTVNIARAMGCSKASVTSMMSNLMEMGYLVKERYGKIYLTDTGFLKARELSRCVEALEERIPNMELELTEEEISELACTLVTAIPERCLKELTGREWRAQVWSLSNALGESG